MYCMSECVVYAIRLSMQSMQYTLEYLLSTARTKQHCLMRLRLPKILEPPHLRRLTPRPRRLHYTALLPTHSLLHLPPFLLPQRSLCVRTHRSGAVDTSFHSFAFLALHYRCYIQSPHPLPPILPPPPLLHYAQPCGLCKGRHCRTASLCRYT